MLTFIGLYPTNNMNKVVTIKQQAVQYGDGRIVTLSPNIDIPWDSCITYLGGVDFCGGGEEIYVVSLPRVLKLVACPVGGFPVRSHSTVRLIENFVYWHWKAKDAILQDLPAPLLRCGHCVMNMPEAWMKRHRRTDTCKKATDIFLGRRDV